MLCEESLLCCLLASSSTRPLGTLPVRSNLMSVIRSSPLSIRKELSCDRALQFATDRSYGARIHLFLSSCLMKHSSVLLGERLRELPSPHKASNNILRTNFSHSSMSCQLRWLTIDEVVHLLSRSCWATFARSYVRECKWLPNLYWS